MTGAGHNPVGYARDDGSGDIDYHRHPLEDIDGDHRVTPSERMSFDAQGHTLAGEDHQRGRPGISAARIRRPQSHVILRAAA